MGQSVIDSNVVIGYLGGDMPADATNFVSDIINSIAFISVITKIEVLGFKNSEADDQLLNDFVSSCLTIDLTDEVIEHTIQLRKAYKIKVPDAIIAATAIILKVPLITRDINDFKYIDGLFLINPWEI